MKVKKVAINSEPHYDDVTLGAQDIKKPKFPPSLSPYETVGTEPTRLDTGDTIEGVTRNKDKDMKDEKVPINSKPHYNDVTLGAQDIKRPQSPPALSPYETVGSEPTPLDTYDTIEGVTGSQDKDIKGEKVAINSKPQYDDVTLGAKDIKRPQPSPALAPYETVEVEPTPLDTYAIIEGVTRNKDSDIKGKKVAINSKPHYNDVTLGAQDIKRPQPLPSLSPYETVGIEPTPPDTHDTIEGVTGSKDKDKKDEKVPLNSKPQYDEVTLGAQDIKRPQSPPSLSPYETVGTESTPLNTCGSIKGVTRNKDNDIKGKNKVAINSKPHYDDVTLGAQDIKRPQSPPSLSPYETVGTEPTRLDTGDTIEGVTRNKDSDIKGKKVAINFKSHYNDVTLGAQDIKRPQTPPALSPYERVGSEPTPLDNYDTIEGVTGSKDKDMKDEKVAINSKPQYDDVTLGAQDIKMPKSPQGMSPYESVGIHPPDTYDNVNGATGEKDEEVKGKGGSNLSPSVQRRASQIYAQVQKKKSYIYAQVNKNRK